MVRHVVAILTHRSSIEMKANNSKQRKMPHTDDNNNNINNDIVYWISKQRRTENKNASCVMNAKFRIGIDAVVVVVFVVVFSCPVCTFVSDDGQGLLFAVSVRPCIVLATNEWYIKLLLFMCVGVRKSTWIFIDLGRKLISIHSCQYRERVQALWASNRAKGERTFGVWWCQWFLDDTNVNELPHSYWTRSTQTFSIHEKTLKRNILPDARMGCHWKWLCSWCVASINDLNSSFSACSLSAQFSFCHSVHPIRIQMIFIQWHILITSHLMH